METADARGSDTLGHHAQYTRDKIEEEYSIVCFEMEVLERRRVFERMAKKRNEEPRLSEGKMQAGMIVDSLIDAFVIVSESSFERR